MTKVFIPELFQLNKKAALQYGNIIELLPKNKLGIEPDRIKYLMTDQINNYNSDDYLLLDGHNSHCSVAASIIASKYNHINLLLWKGDDKTYVLRQVMFYDIPKSLPIISNPRIFMVNNIHYNENINLSHKIHILVSGSDINHMEPEIIKQKMIPMLQNSHKHDFLLLSGSKTHSAIASAIMSRMHNSVNYMIWDVKRKKYVKRTVLFN